MTAANTQLSSHRHADVLQEIMKRITTIALSLIAVATLCLAVGDPVVSTETKKKAQVTTYQRDGTNILRYALYYPDDPEKRMLRQQILIGETKVAEIVDFQGKLTFDVQPNIPVSFGATYTSTGGLENVVLMDDIHGVLEAYETIDGSLRPAKGWELDTVRELTSDFSEFIDAVKEKKEPKEELMGRLTDMVIKAKIKEMQNK
jgi:hypothetical protein